MRFLDGGHQDFQHAIHMLAQHPSFTAAAVLRLALGLGAQHGRVQRR